MATTAASLGNAFHTINILNIALYGWAVFQERGGESPKLLDELWLRHGFCLNAEDETIPFQTTHDLSAYVMTLISLAGLVLWYFVFPPRTRTTMKAAEERFFWAIMGALGHAAGHELIANANRFGIFPPGNETPVDNVRGDPAWLILAKLGPGYPLFWIPLVKTYMPHIANQRVALVALLVQIGALFIPLRFGFAYTQSVLFVGLSIDQLLLSASEKRGFEYALWPIMTVIPSGIMSWVEAIGCTTNPIMLHYGGHVAYDALMASSYILYYLVCWFVLEAKNTSVIREELKKIK